jgi:AraC-like DNA-binding protein
MPMIDIAECVGYGSKAAFGRAFKREVGITPWAGPAL